MRTIKTLYILSAMLLSTFLFSSCTEEESADIASLIVGTYTGSGEDSDGMPFSGSIEIIKISNDRINFKPAADLPLIEMEIGLLFNGELVTGSISSAPAFFSVELDKTGQPMNIEQFNIGVTFGGTR